MGSKLPNKERLQRKKKSKRGTRKLVVIGALEPLEVGRRNFKATSAPFPSLQSSSRCGKTHRG